MNREKYLAYLDKQNGYCECPPLAELFERRKEVVGLENRCDLYRADVDLDNPKSEDKQFLLGYKKAAKSLKAERTGYYVELSQLISSGDLRPKIHDEATQSSDSISVNPEQIIQLIEKTDAIISLHCARCDQQIDVAEKLN